MHDDLEADNSRTTNRAFALLPEHFHLGPTPLDGSTTLDRLRHSSVVATLVDAMCADLGTTNRQVGASVLMQRLALALTGPTLAATLLHDRMPTAELAQIHVAVVAATPHVAFAPTTTQLHRVDAGGPSGLLSSWHSHWIGNIFKSVINNIRHVEPCAVRTLWGNVVGATIENLATLDWSYPERQIKTLSTGLYASEGLYRRHAQLDDHTFEGRAGMLRARTTCCLLTKVDPEGSCVSCPNLSGAERAETIDRFFATHRPAPAT